MARGMSRGRCVHRLIVLAHGRAGAGADQIRAGGQPQDCEGDWLRSAVLEPCGSHLFSRRILFLRRFCFNRICLFLFLWLNFFIAVSTSLRGWWRRTLSQMTLRNE
jgi:hypothetical protein